MSVLIKYKLSDLAKDLGIPNKDLIDLFRGWTGETKKHTSPLTQAELNRVFEHYTRETAEESLDAYLSSTPAPKKAGETAEKAAAKQPESAKPQAERPAAKQPESAKPQAERPAAKQPESAKPQAERPAVKQPENAKPQAERPAVKQPENAKPQAERPAAKPQAERPAVKQPESAKPQAERPAAKQPENAKPQAERPAVKQPENAKPQAERPAVKQDSGKQPNRPNAGQPVEKGQPPRKNHVPTPAAPPAKRKERIRHVKDEPEKKSVQEKREMVTVTVNTRTTDVNLDKFNEKYSELASTKNVENRRKPTPAGNKQKFSGRSAKRNQPFQKKRETEAERLQRIQLEKARKAQLRVSIPDEINVGELASRLKVNVAQVIKKLMGLGVMASAAQTVDFDTASLVAEELGARVEHEVHVTIEQRLFEVDEDREEDLAERPPVVVVMGHVDHGKTSILDAIRKTRVTAGEAGGITQHIGAYQVEMSGKRITFLDTPGHEAFTSMRARGANLTDIAVLVVAADDGIMPQTIESINHAKAANTTVIVAINKMDKPTANANHVMEQLTQYELVPEEWGGETICVPVSAMTGQGISDLLESINLVAEVKELRANPHRRAKGAVIEARLDKGQGPVATILVQKGTLHQGDVVIAGTSVGRVRVMRDDQGNILKEAGPSTPVEITGLTEVPAAGDLFDAVEDEKLARELADRRAAEQKEQQFKSYRKVTLDNLFSQIAEGERKELAIIVKADVQGSAEAVKQSLEKISNDEVRVRVIHAGVGAINKSDVMLANAGNAIIIGFNVRPDPVAKEEAASAEVEMRMYRVIYDAINDVTDAMKGMLAPKYREVELGRAEVRNVFKISSVGTIAGCYVQEGKVLRSAKIRLVRDGIVITENEISSLRRFKDDVKEVAQGYECGIGLDKFSDIKEGDIFEAFTIEEYRD